ncbi:MAG: ABC transporter permease, partial [Acidimicrobiales bacterium]
MAISPVTTSPSNAKGKPMALRVFEHHMVVYRHTYRGTLVSSFVSPLLFLAAMGVALGSLVDEGPGASRLDGISYLSFVAPGLLAAFAMQSAVGESTFPIMGGIKWLKTFHGMLATPLGVVDVIGGVLLWIAFRVAIVAVAYLLVIVVFGVATSWLSVLAVPAAVLTGL